MRWLLACCLVVVQSVAVAAQEDKDRITTFLQDSLSGAGRDVQIEGFQGALSSRATMDKLTIADDAGIWLTLTDAVLDWNRSAVLRGRIEINELSAAQIQLTRLPAGGGDPSSPAAGTFALPELPVSLRIDAIKAARVSLGAPVIGQAATLSVAGSVSLADGQGSAKLDIKRIEGPEGSFALTAAFSNVTQVLGIDLALREAANGLSANLLDIPDKPALELVVKGEAPLDRFVADIALRSDGQDRLSGRIGTQSTTVAPNAQTPQRVIEADLSGDLAPLFLPQYQEFFGPDVGLQSRVSLFQDGRISLDNLNVTAAALRLSGQAVLSADRLPEEFRLDAVLQDPSGGLVLLPLSGPETQVRRAVLTAGFDASRGDAWSLSGDLEAFAREDMAIDRLRLETNGTIRQGEARQVTARVDADASGITFSDAAIASALGDRAMFGADVIWNDGQLVQFNGFDLSAPGMQLSGSGTVDGLDSAIEVQGDLAAQVEDIARFSAISGQTLQGEIDANLIGEFALLTGAFDLDLRATARDLGVGVAEIDEALQGDSDLQISAIRDSEGLTVDTLAVTAGPLRVTGDLTLAADWLPQAFNLTAALQNAQATPVLLPLMDQETRVTRATVEAGFDAAQGEAWTLSGDLTGLRRADVALDRLLLDAKGTIARGDIRRVSARIDGSANGISLDDPALAAALGREITLGTDILWQDDQPVAFSDFNLIAPGMALRGAGTVDLRTSDTAVQGAIRAEIDDLSRLARLSGQPLRGAVTADVVGQASLQSQSFDLDLSANGQNLRIGVAQVNEVLAGQSRLEVSAAGTPDAVTLRGFKVVTPLLDAQASGKVKEANSDLSFSASLRRTELFYDALPGATSLTGRAVQDSVGWAVSLDATAPRGVVLDASVSLPKQGSAEARFDLGIGSLSWVAPELAGPGRLSGIARQSGTDWALDVTGDGPGGTDVTVVGQIAENASRAALAINGQASLGLLNRRLAPNSMQGVAEFALRLDGPLAVSSLRGELRTNEARLALPGLRNALSGIDARVTLDGRNAQLDVTTNVATGGQVNARGRVGMQTPFVSEVALQLNNVTVSDPELYQTGVNGALRLSGPVASGLSVVGDLALDQTEIRVPSTGIGAFGDIPDITHVNEPSAVRRTRSYAGLLDVTGANTEGGGSAIGLDVRINAENRIFVRGRGLDAELGGRVRLMGTTADVIAQGQFGLIRGRLDVLGKRLTLEEGSARLQGSLIPALRLVARTTVEDTVILVIVEGPADAPEIRFESQPELPEDEVLARLLFGRDIRSISALQAVQLASAVATLAGRGGAGIVERLRKSTGFDDLDVTSDGEGTTSVRAGKYINENVYTDVIIDSNGKSRVNLNLDLGGSTTLRGEVSSDGSTGIGIFFERDY